MLYGPFLQAPFRVVLKEQIRHRRGMEREMAGVRNLQERRKKARKALTAFGKRARAACEKISTPDESYEMINPLERILEEFGDDMPAGMREGLEAASNITDPT